jgi:hypothetical protein
MPNTATMTAEEKLAYVAHELLADYVAATRRGEGGRCEVLAEVLFMIETGTHYDADWYPLWDEFAGQLAGEANEALEA